MQEGLEREEKEVDRKFREKLVEVFGSHSAEGFRTCLQQAVSFMICFHISYLFVIYSENFANKGNVSTEFTADDSFLIDIPVFLVFSIGYPWLMARWYQIVLALPPFFDADDMLFVEVALAENRKARARILKGS